MVRRRQLLCASLRKGTITARPSIQGSAVRSSGEQLPAASQQVSRSGCARVGKSRSKLPRTERLDSGSHCQSLHSSTTRVGQEADSRLLPGDSQPFRMDVPEVDGRTAPGERSDQTHG